MLFFSIGLVKSSVDTACLYNEFLCRSLKSPHTVKQYVSGIKLLGLFAFLGLSNLVPSSKYKRNKNKHLCRSNICEVENGLALSGRAFHGMCTAVVARPTDPLFVLPDPKSNQLTRWYSVKV